MAMETWRGKTYDTQTGREWTEADSEAVRRWVEESDRYIRKCPACKQWAYDTREGKCGNCGHEKQTPRFDAFEIGWSAA